MTTNYRISFRSLSGHKVKYFSTFDGMFNFASTKGIRIIEVSEIKEINLTDRVKSSLNIK